MLPALYSSLSVLTLTLPACLKLAPLVLKAATAISLGPAQAEEGKASSWSLAV